MKKNDNFSCSLNLWISYVPVALTIMIVDWDSFFAFSFGTIGAFLSLLLMLEDAKKIQLGDKRTLKFGFLKRYGLSAIVFLISSIFGIKGVIFAFFGLELLRLTLTTYVGSGKT